MYKYSLRRISYHLKNNTKLIPIKYFSKYDIVHEEHYQIIQTKSMRYDEFATYTMDNII